MGRQPSGLWRNLRSYQIYGANTDVGKTIMTTILCKAFCRAVPGENVWYLKPVSTGPLSQADSRHISRFSPTTRARCLYQFGEPVSPHIAAAEAKTSLSDATVLGAVLEELMSCARAGPGSLFLETAGGVNSPGPSGNSQANLYRPLRLPALLVADSRLGGISATISAFESLYIRGYDVESILVFEDSRYENSEYLHDHFGKMSITTVSLPLPPPRQGFSEAEDSERMEEYYERTHTLGVVDEMISSLSTRHASRIENLESMGSRALRHIWYPFTQHRNLSHKDIMVIDSAYGDCFQAYSAESSWAKNSDHMLLEQTFDGSASWWTQGVGHGNHELSLAAAHAAGRYGHVMFAGAIHEPAVLLAELLLRKLENPRLRKVFYSDNGSTGMEVAIKMALTAASERYAWDARARSKVGILGLKGSYHGDTIGAMDCSEPSAFNVNVPWYRGRGGWFDVPQVKMKRGIWVVELPHEMEQFSKQRTVNFASLDAIFDLESREYSITVQTYVKYIEDKLDRLVREEGQTFGALIIEPVILGAGGMILVDPLFQHILAGIVRAKTSLFNSSSRAVSDAASSFAWTGLPIIHDEVFTGLFRLGRFSSSTFIGVQPDISVHAKLLTGGLVPLAATVASESIFEAFIGSDVKNALLHGHSYTAHAVGCEVAGRAVKMLADMAAREGEKGWDLFRKDWGEDADTQRRAGPENDGRGGLVWSMWSKEFVVSLSHVREVESVIALGSVLAISLRASDGSTGYTSTAARGLQARVFQSPTATKEHGDVDVGLRIHSRVLGNVFYLMAAPTTPRCTVRELERVVSTALRSGSHYAS